MKLTQAVLVVAATVFSLGIAKPERGPVARWTFDAIEKGVVKDLTGHGLDAVSHGAKLVDGKHGQALLGDGQGYLEVQHAAILDAFPDGITIAVWVYREPSTAWNCVVTRETRDTWSEYFDIAVSEDKPLFSVDPDGNSFARTEYPQPMPVHQWVHLAGTFDNTTYRLYVDGKEVASGAKAMPFRFADKNPLIIGSNTNDQGKTMHDHFFGRIDDLAIYDRALSAAELATLSR